MANGVSSADFVVRPANAREKQSYLLTRVLVSFLGQGCAILSAAICIPIYVRLLGMEIFGLISFQLMLQAIIRVLDMGMTPTVIREVALATATKDRGTDLRSVVFTFECAFAITAAFIAVVLTIAAPPLSSTWLDGNEVAEHIVFNCVVVIGLQCGVLWLSQFYHNVTVGLEKQVLANLLRISEITLNATGSVALMYYFDRRVELLFVWQCLNSIGFVFIYRVILLSTLPASSKRASFMVGLLLRNWRFAAGMSVVAAVGTVQTQLDKLVASALLPLAAFGRYSLASLVATSLFSLLTAPLSYVFLPRLSRLYAENNCVKIWELYRFVNQAVAAISISMLVVVVSFGSDGFKWLTGDSNTATESGRLLAWFALGMTLNCLYWPPYLLQLSHGITRLASRIGVALLFLCCVSLWFMVTHFGIEGGAINFAAIQLLSLCIGVPLTYALVLPGRRLYTYALDVGPSILLGSFTAVAVHRLASVVPGVPWWRFLLAMVTGLALPLGCIFASSRLRRELFAKDRVFP
jgi:O-antigen/teichoic acid export membrane protein